ncbi:ATP-binding cassette [Salpingoeca rosetta]|uniref:ATP-binding cassette n=1 Tax=Salpingoeca rosetta (strain ATCC 50818 / BSB-021) TaxID=946362 RepID=F2U9I6_SALR5|nr:ATP-binding cassette [Salpingoeca rosetta]EGD73013.1 ATP-binding cassette [Salpingoeca rosetta]|eukprot:XP_004994044.1 ATP-binding cassette [Salpingoeca rosetta]
MSIGLLLWKNFTLARRRPWATAFEIILPIAFMCILVGVRQSTLKKAKHECVGGCVYDEFSPSNTGIMLPPCPKGWTMYYTPNTPNVTEIMSSTAAYLATYSDNMTLSAMKGFASEDAMVSELVSIGSGCKFGVVMSKPTTDTYDYTLRFDSTPGGYDVKASFGSRWMTTISFPEFQLLGPRDDSDLLSATYGSSPGYAQYGFTQAQHAINMAIANATGLQDVVDTLSRVRLQRMPYPEYLDDGFLYAIKFGLPLLLMIALLFTALTVVRNIVHEKERRLKESMKMMGLKNWNHWLAWFIQAFSFLAVSMTVIAFICKGGQVLQHSDPTVIWVYLLAFALATVNLCFLISVFFTKASTGAAAGGIIWFCTYVPYMFIGPRYQAMSFSTKQSSCFVSTTAMAIGAQLIAEFEGRGDGVQWATLTDPVSADDPFTFGTIIGMLLFDSIVYAVLTWYIEAVFPGEYGIPLPWYFPLTKSYWCGATLAAEHDPLMGKGVAVNADNFEAEPEGLHAGVRIQDLRKVFGTKVAVAGTRLNMYEGQITALLGHNGAGKTTTMSMLTGLYPPTSGTAIVNGHDIRTDINGVRRSLGICPQHDVLFDTLTVEEHLAFFCKLKGVPKPEIQTHIDEMIESLQLPDKRHAMVKTLSGGMKRKLSCAIAIVGGSKVVFLDEPTSGMDPSARRATWDLLSKYKHTCTMILSTHFLDEADLLGDRIAIMSEGVVECCGSSTFLKSRYGVGYHMIVVKDKNCKPDTIAALIKQHVPTATLEADIGAEMTFLLPRTCSSAFPQLFHELEQQKQVLGLLSVGVSVTTMEEVFLKVGERAAAATLTNENEDAGSADKDGLLAHRGHGSVSSRGGYGALTTDGDEVAVGGGSGNNPNGGYTSDLQSDLHALDEESSDETALLMPVSAYDRLNTGFKLKTQQLHAMLVKRMLHSKRNFTAVFTQLLLPMAFVLIALVVAKTYPGPKDDPARQLYDFTSSYGPNTLLYSSQFGSNDSSTFVPATPVTQKLAGSLQRVVLGASETPEQQAFEDIAKSGISFNDTATFVLKLIGNAPDKVAKFNKKDLLSAAFRPTPNSTTVEPLALFNGQAYHTIVEALGMVDSALLHAFSDGSVSVRATNFPLPRSPLEKAQDQGDSQQGFYIAFTILFGMAFLVSSFVLFLVVERANKAKHIQFVSGVDIVSYWAASYAWDVLNFLLPTVGCIILFLIFNVQEYAEERLGYVVLLFVLYGFAVIPTMYLASFLFSTPSKAYTMMTVVNIVTGLAAMLTVSILETVEPSVATQLKSAFLFLPNYCFGQALSDIYNNYQSLQVIEQLLPLCRMFAPGASIDTCCNLAEKIPSKDLPFQLQCQTDFLSMSLPGIGRYVLCLVAQAIVFFLLVLAVEAKLVRAVVNMIIKPPEAKSGLPDGEDEDVRQEREDVLRKVSGLQSHIRSTNSSVSEMHELPGSRDVLLVNNLSKTFSISKGACGSEPKYAVDRLSFAVPNGQCFGLLGVNGAGKTTTFRMLTGDEVMTAGSAQLNGFDIRTQMAQARQHMGYCPQFDGLIELMTGRELLVMYARLRGVPEQGIPSLVNDLIHELMLEKHADKPCGTYSGGNKRKLSTAIALCGPSPVIYLDEPTTGMDPGARRFLWNTLLRVMQSGRSIVLTSHSMEECEALCTRLAIMVNGRFQCIGSLQRLKDRFGRSLNVVITAPRESMAQLKDFFASKFPTMNITDEHQNQITFELSGERKWSYVFTVMEEAKQNFPIRDYSVSQTTLEQVFLRFAKHQFDE